MDLRRRFFGMLALATTLATLCSCSMGQLARIADSGDTSVLPDEMQKFEVKESAIGAPTSPASTSAAAEGALEDKKKLSKNAKKKGTAALKQAVADSNEKMPFSWPVRRPDRDAIWPSEQMVYTISYFGMPAGDFTLEVLPYKTVNNRKVYHIKGVAVSSRVFSLFYRLNDSVESYFDFDGLFSHRFHMELDETKQTRNSLELNDSEKGQTYYWNRWNHHTKGYSEKKEFQPMIPFSQDSLSALYYMRSVKLPPEGESFSFPVISEGRNWEAVVTVMGRETIDTPMGKMKVVKLKPETKYAGVLKKQGDSFLWMTDDDRRVLIRMEAKVRIGTVVAALKKFSAGSQPQ